MPYKDKAKRKQYMHEHYLRNKKKYREWAEKSAAKTRRLHRGSTPLNVKQETVEAIWKAQGECCAICKRKLAWKETRMDHNHNTLKLRGVLCGNCNPGIGQFKDNPEFLEAAAAYLRRYDELV